MKRFIVSVLGSSVLALAVGAPACGPAYYVDVDNDPVLADQAPPDDLDETPPPAPWDGAVWTRGYWYWTGDRYVWVAGQWSRPPAVNFVWVHPGWVFMNNHYRFVPGRWAHPQRVPRYPYYRPAPRPQPGHPSGGHPGPHR